VALRALVTGANGVLGHELVASLRDAGFQVLATGREGAPGLDAAWDVASEDSPNTTFRPDVVVHNAAARGRLGHAPEFAGNLFQVNIEGTRRVVAWCARQQVSHMVYISGAVVYGEWNSPRHEREQPEPWRAGSYAVSKFCGELVTRQLEQENIPVTIVRPGSLMGVGYKDNLLERFVRQGLAGRIDLAPPFDDAFDFVHVRDVARTVLSVIASTSSGIWNLGAGRLWTVQEIARECADATGAQLNLKPGAPARPPRILNWVDDTAARGRLGHVNRLTVPDALMEIIQQGRQP
jgi:dTDP-4-dehydrorhamnose reductase